MTGSIQAPQSACPTCRGSGGGDALVNHAGTCTWQHVTCSTCTGSGTVTAEHARRIAKGEQQRRARVERGESLREMADRLNMSPIDLSHLEQGREA